MKALETALRVARDDLQFAKDKVEGSETTRQSLDLLLEQTRVDLQKLGQESLASRELQEAMAEELKDLKHKQQELQKNGEPQTNYGVDEEQELRTHGRGDEEDCSASVKYGSLLLLKSSCVSTVGITKLSLLHILLFIF